MNYTWMPELTIRMAHKFAVSLPIGRSETVLDFGCAKGFLVKAFRILDIEAFGADISVYAIGSTPSEVRKYCRLTTGCDDPQLFDRSYDWLIAKDVFEHIVEPDLRVFLRNARGKIRKMFAAIPLAADDESGGYIIPAYDEDITHVLAKTLEWWSRLFESEGWRILQVSDRFEGCKENWTSKWDNGNAFFILADTSK